MARLRRHRRLPPFAPTLAGEASNAGADAIAWTIYLGLVPTALGFATWTFALRRTSAGRMGSITYLVPLVAIVLGWALLGEAPPWLAVAGGAVCLVEVYLTGVRKHGREAADRPPAWEDSVERGADVGEERPSAGWRKDHALDRGDGAAEISGLRLLALTDEPSVVAVDDDSAVRVNDRGAAQGVSATTPVSRFVHSMWKLWRMVFTVPSAYVHVWIVPELCTGSGRDTRRGPQESPACDPRASRSGQGLPREPRTRGVQPRAQQARPSSCRPPS